jgi:hypothetical protein
MPGVRKIKLGVNSRIYLVDGTTFTDVTLVRDLSVNASSDKADANVRGSRVNAAVKTNLSLAVTGAFKDDGSALAHTIIDACVAPDAIVRVLVLNGSRTTVDARGFMFDAQIHMTGESQNIDEVIYPEIEIFPTPTDYTPKACKVIAGSPPVLHVSEITGEELDFAAP